MTAPGAGLQIGAQLGQPFGRGLESGRGAGPLKRGSAQNGRGPGLPSFCATRQVVAARIAVNRKVVHYVEHGRGLQITANCDRT